MSSTCPFLTQKALKKSLFIGGFFVSTNLAILSLVK